MSSFLRSYFPVKPTLLEKDVNNLEEKVSLIIQYSFVSILIILTPFCQRFSLLLEVLEV